MGNGLMVDVGFRESLPRCTVLLHGSAGSGKMTVVRAASCRLHLHLLKVGFTSTKTTFFSFFRSLCSAALVVVCVQVDCVTMCADTPAASEAKLASAFQRAEALQPCVLLLRNLQLLVRPRGAEEDGRVQAALCHLLNSAPTRSRPPPVIFERDKSGHLLPSCKLIQF